MKTKARKPQKRQKKRPAGRKPQKRPKPEATKPATPLENALLIIGANIRRFRLENGWTQEYMARFGFEVVHFRRVELGQRNVTIDYLVRVAEALGVSLFELITPR